MVVTPVKIKKEAMILETPEMTLFTQTFLQLEQLTAILFSRQVTISLRLL